MKCPNCGSGLERGTVLGFDDSFKCGGCGGWWVANWVVNNIAGGKEMVVGVEIGGKRAVEQSGTGMCPTDGSKLRTPPQEAVPEGLGVQKCEACGWWWFGTGDLGAFQAAYASKNSYLKYWKKPEWMTYAWPALVLAMMAFGVGGGVWLVRTQQRANISASYGVREVIIIDRGFTDVEIWFKANAPVAIVEYRVVGTSVWSRAQTEQDQEGFRLILSGLVGGERYEVRLGGKNYQFIKKELR